MRSACSASRVSWAFSTRATMSPMPEDAPRDPVGVELLEGVHALAEADELDRLAGDRAHRERRAAAAVAVHAGEHDARDADPSVELLGDVDGVLAGQAVDHQQRLVGPGRVANRLDLGHQVVVDVQPPGGVEHDHVVAAERRLLAGALGDRDRVLPGDDRQRVDADLDAEDGELLHRRRPAGVERGHQHALALALLEPLGELRRRRGLAASPGGRPSGSARAASRCAGGRARPRRGACR